MASGSNAGKTTAKNVGRVSSVAAARQIMGERGVLGLFTGFRLHFYRDVLGTGLYFGIYETLKQSINSAYGSDKVNAPGAVAFAGAACGVLSWTMVSAASLSSFQTNTILDLPLGFHEDSGTEPTSWIRCKGSHRSRQVLGSKPIEVERTRDGHPSIGSAEHDSDDPLRISQGQDRQFVVQQW